MLEWNGVATQKDDENEWRAERVRSDRKNVREELVPTWDSDVTIGALFLACSAFAECFSPAPPVHDITRDMNKI